MASSAKTHFHARSNSLPSTPHPLFSQLDEHMCRVRGSLATSTSSSIGHKLSGLQDLYDCVDMLLVLPLSQKSLLAQKGSFDELLDGSLRLLDMCNVAKDALSQLKECVVQLQSTFRRRQGGDMGEIRKYLASRKVAKKAITKALKNLKARNLSSNDNDLLSNLREVEAITLGVLKSMLSFICEPKTRTKAMNHWTLVSKFVQQRKLSSCEEGKEEEEANEFADVDDALESLVNCKASKFESALNRLKNLESCIQDFEEGTECLFRRMIKTRVSLLNVFN